MVNKCVAFGCKTDYASEKVADCSVENDQKNCCDIPLSF